MKASNRPGHRRALKRGRPFSCGEPTVRVSVYLPRSVARRLEKLLPDRSNSERIRAVLQRFFADG